MAASTLRRCSAARRAVVQGDGQVVVVELPQLLEGELGLKAGVDEDQRGAGLFDDLIDLAHGVLGGVAGPGHAALGQQDVDDGLGAAGATDEVDGLRGATEARRRVLLEPADSLASDGSSGSSTVAERPTRRRRGANCCRRARSRASRSPRLEAWRAWISSRITQARSWK